MDGDWMGIHIHDVGARPKASFRSGGASGARHVCARYRNTWTAGVWTRGARGRHGRPVSRDGATYLSTKVTSVKHHDDMYIDDPRGAQAARPAHAPRRRVAVASGIAAFRRTVR